MVLNIEESNIFRSINNNLTEEDIKMMHPQSLAFIGDGVFELVFRTYLLDKDIGNHKLHRMTSTYVNAKAQRKFYEIIEDHLSDREKSIVNRGKNSKNFSLPKNADPTDYRWATGLEALFGYLYLMGQDERIKEIFDIWRQYES